MTEQKSNSDSKRKDAKRTGSNVDTRPPFPKQNTVKLSHGAKSARIYDPLALELAEGLLADKPDLAKYPHEVAAWARAEARTMLLDRHSTEVGLLDETGEPRKFAWLMSSLERQAANARLALGLTPGSEAQLAKDRAEATLVAVDLEAVAERGRGVLTSEFRFSEPAPDTAGEVLARVNRDGLAQMEQAEREHKAHMIEQEQQRHPEQSP